MQPVVNRRSSAGARERVRDHYEKRAASYDRVIRLPEALLFAGGRRWACGQAQGEVLELAAGTGRNLPYYRADVRLTAIELSPAMLAVARGRAERLGRPADLRVGDAEALDFPDERFDTVLATLALCSIPDDARAVAEARRVLRPGGRLILLEHVRSPVNPVRAIQRLLDPLFVRFECDHLLREPLEHARGESLEVESCQRFKWGLVERLVAKKPL
jgi:SAM-dependent methyltransferase